METVSTISRKINYDCLDDFTDPVPIIPDDYLEKTFDNPALYDDVTCEFPVIVIDDVSEKLAKTSDEKTNVNKPYHLIRAITSQESPDYSNINRSYIHTLLSLIFAGALVAALISATIFNSDHRYAVAHAFPIFGSRNHSYFQSNKDSARAVRVDFANIPRMRRKIVNNLDSELSEQSHRLQQINNSLRPMYVLPVDGDFTSAFSYRWGAMHTGIDIAAPIGTAIRSVSDGTVIEAGWVGGFGQWVRVQADDGTVNVYGHVNSIEVIKDQRVSAGQVIATVGNLGFATGPHLHFEVWVDGKWKVDPAGWLAQRGISLNRYHP